MTPRVIIDTDVGTDVDDLWTLAMVPRLDLDLEAVTVVYGDTALRSRLARHALDVLALTASVHRGVDEPRSGADVLWAGHEGAGTEHLDLPTAPADAIDALVDAAASRPGSLHVVAIGPLTNLAAALDASPSFARDVAGFTIMGGEFRGGHAEHNIASDVDAAHRVLTSGVATTIIGLDQTLRIRLDRADCDAIAAANPLGSLLRDEAERFWSWLDTVVPGFAGGASPAHDPAALLTLVRPDLFSCTPVTLDVATLRDDGRLRAEPDPASPVRIVTDMDVPAVHAAMLDAFGVPGT